MSFVPAIKWGRRDVAQPTEYETKTKPIITQVSHCMIFGGVQSVLWYCKPQSNALYVEMFIQIF